MDRVRDGMARASGFFNGRLFSTSFKTKMHWIQLSLVVLIICLTGARIATKPSFMPVTRSDTLAIVMGIKTIVVISYQLLSSHVARFRRWRNTKVYLVLNSMEVVFWFVVVIITFMGMSRYCQGTYCGLTVLVALIAMILTTFAFWTAIATRRLRQEERYGGPSPATFVGQTETTQRKPAESAAYNAYQV